MTPPTHLLDASKITALVEKCASEFEQILGESDHVWIPSKWFSSDNRTFWKPLLDYLEHQSTLGNVENDFKHVHSFKNQELHIYAYGNKHYNKKWNLLSKKRYPISEVVEIFKVEKVNIMRNSENCPDRAKKALIDALGKGLGEFRQSGIKRQMIGGASKNKKLRQDPTHIRNENKENIEPREGNEGAQLKSALEMVEQQRHLIQKVTEDNQRLTQKLVDENGIWIRTNDELRKEFTEKLSEMKGKSKTKEDEHREKLNKSRQKSSDLQKQQKSAALSLREKDHLLREKDHLLREKDHLLRVKDLEIAEAKSYGLKQEATVEELKATVEQAQNFCSIPIDITPVKEQAAKYTKDANLTPELCFIKMSAFRNENKQYKIH